MAHTLLRWRLNALLCVLLATIHSVSALTIAYCSTENTGGSLALTSIYNSNGKCHDECDSSYAFAIVQDDDCWCSNYIPETHVATSQCNESCPGYPSDICGNSALGLYGYIQLDLAASGTSGSGAAQTSTPTSGTTTSSTSSPTVQVVTIGGSTQTVTTTPTAATGALLGSTEKKSSSLSGGLIAAAVVASIFGVIIFGAIIFFVLRRRRKNQEDEKFGGLNDDPSSPANINRNTSTNSKAGLLDRGYPPTITTRMSSHTAQDMTSSSDGVSPVTSNSDRRHSRPLMYDQRLNPNALMVIDNGSHTSLHSLDDHRDYGRMLKVVNPDAPPRSSIS